jgi:hypothetical protein
MPTMRYRPASKVPGRNRSPDLGSLPGVDGGGVYDTAPPGVAWTAETVGVLAGSISETPQAEQKLPLAVISA